VVAAAVGTSRASVADAPSFTRDVAPILVRNCLGCHNDKKAEADLNMKTFALLRKGGKSLGDGILEPGDPDASYLVEVIRPDASPRMPFKLKPLSEAQIEVIARWVVAGARFDGPSESDTPIASLVDPLSTLPAVSASASVRPKVSSVAFSLDGTRLAAAVGREVRIFDAKSAKPEGAPLVHADPVTWVRFLADGKTLVTTGGRPSMFGVITLWDVSGARKRLEMKGHADTILGAALASDDRTLATASYDRLVKLWDLVEGKELRELREHTDAVYGVAFSPDGTRVASVAGDRTLKIWDAATGRRLVSFSDATAELYAVVFAPDGGTVLAGGVDRTVRAWRLQGESGSLAGSAFAHDAPVLSLQLTPDGKTLVSSSEDRAIKLWDLATLSPRGAFPKQADWPLGVAVSPDGDTIAVGRYDGALLLADATTGKPSATLIESESEVATNPNAADSSATAAHEEKTKPALVRDASLGPPSPRSGQRGTTVTINLSGDGVGLAQEIVFADPGIKARLLPREKPDPNAATAELVIASDARPGFHAFRIRTPLGTPPAQTFLVSADAELNIAEPDDEPAKAPLATLPTVVAGAIDKAGDIDQVRVSAKAGQTLIVSVLARALGSALNPSIALLDDSGKPLAVSARTDEGREPTMVFTPESDTALILRIGDVDQGGSGNHIYRVSLGVLPQLQAVFPTGVAAGPTTAIDVTGHNLLGRTHAVAPGAGTPAGTLIDVPTDSSAFAPGRERFRLVVSEGSPALETEPNDDPASANPVSAPGGLSGRIQEGGDVDHVRFDARRGERWVVEVFARRIGTPLDPVIEILDDKGNRIPRAVLRPIGETLVAFRDHPSTGRNIRLTYPWTGFGVGDHVVVGRELMRIHELPRGPDDDAVFWGLGNTRNNVGERVALLETTPEHHPQGQPIYEVELHPPGATFPPGGVAPLVLDYRNDDGGPTLGKDARLTFDVPGDGTYLVRVEDVRGLGGPEFGYHILVRPQRPDFRITLATETPNIPRGGALVVPVNLTRLDGFDGPVDVRVENLPSGITATGTRIEADQYTADLLLQAATDAPSFPEGRWKVIAEGTPQPGRAPITHVLEPGGPAAGAITVVENPNLRVAFAPESVSIRPGQEVTMTLGVERGEAFKGRVPIDVRNLPFGVRVLHVGLNGVLITETQTERTITLFAEPWVKPKERIFCAVAKCEAAGTDHSSGPIRLVVTPPEGTSSNSGGD
jgi:WD40 repeat protein